MMVSICVDARGRVDGICPDNLTPSAGWLWADAQRLYAHTGASYAEMYDNLFSERGAPLYEWVDGYAERRAANDIAADEIAPDVPLTLDARLTALEADALTALLAIAELYEGAIT